MFITSSLFNMLYVSALAAEWIEIKTWEAATVQLIVSALAAEWIEMNYQDTINEYTEKGLRPRGGVD